MKDYTGQVYDGDFSALNNTSGTYIQNLVGSPATVNGYFYCGWMHLTSLKGAPTKVTGYFNCMNNYLTTLNELSITCSSFGFRGNNITSLAGIHKYVKRTGSFYCDRNPIESHILGLLLIVGLETIGIMDETIEPIKLIEPYLGKGKPGILQAQRDLIDAGYEEYAEL